MQIVIDIPDGAYEELCNAKFPIQDACRLVAWIKDGTSLPKGHGRLIDAKDLLLDIIAHKYSNNFCEEHDIDWSINVGMLNILIADAPTILGADKEET